jgi:adenylate kinase
MVQLSTGDMLRAARTSGTEMGRKVAAVLDAGGLVTDEIVIGLIDEKLGRTGHGGFIFDGFPRTLKQADALGELMARKGLKLDAVIELVMWTTRRYTCVGRIVNRAEEAKAAGQPTSGKDDTPEVFEVRLREEYYKNTSPLIGYYWAKGDLVQVDGMADMPVVADAIAKVLDKA